MARRKSKKQKEETILDLVEARDNAKSFVEHNQMTIIGVIAGLLLLVGGIFAYFNLYKAPRNVKAMEQMQMAQTQFEQDSFARALEQPGGGYDGFLDIIDNYGGTTAANAAKYYAGISYLRLGRYEAAISYLNDFKPASGTFRIMKNGALGDAYSELAEMEKALSAYKKAATGEENEFLTPYYLDKLAKLYEMQNNFAEAEKYFKEIKMKYPNSTAGRDVEKYITRAELRNKG